MKKLFLIIILLVNIAYSQTTSKENYDMSKEGNVNGATKSVTGLMEFISERAITTSVVIGEVIILILLLYYWKRTKDDSKIHYNNIYRRNIKALRHEKIKPNVDPKKSLKRKILLKNIDMKSINSNTITSSARKLSISKGELFLAAKILQLQNQNR